MATATAIVGSGAFTYEAHDDWAKLPAGWDMPAAAVTVDSQDRVYCFNRTADHPVVVFDRDGNYLSSWGAGLFAFPHTIRADAATACGWWTGITGRCSSSPSTGRCCGRSEPGATARTRGSIASEPRSSAYRKVTHGGGPFNLPTDIAVAPSGEMFVTDGYGNARVHKFAADGTHLLSWGEPGTGPGQFSLPHGIWIDRHGRVMVCDRENDRVQVFDQQGTFLAHLAHAADRAGGLLRGPGGHRLHPGAQRGPGERPDPGGRAPRAVGRSQLPLVPLDLGRFARRSVRRPAGGLGAGPARREVRARELRRDHFQIPPRGSGPSRRPWPGASSRPTPRRNASGRPF